MSRRKQSSPAEDLVEVTEFVFRYVPPWVSIPFARAAFFGISTWLNHSLKTAGLAMMGYLLGILIALAILVGGFGGYRYRQRHAAFLRQNITLGWVNGLSWQEFENLDGETTLVQCRRWKVFKVGVKPIREFFGVMASEGVDRGIFRIQWSLYERSHSIRGWQTTGTHRRSAIRRDGQSLSSSRSRSRNRGVSSLVGGHNTRPTGVPHLWQTDGAPASQNREERWPGVLGLFGISAVPGHTLN